MKVYESKGVMMTIDKMGEEEINCVSHAYMKTICKRSMCSGFLWITNIINSQKENMPKIMNGTYQMKLSIYYTQHNHILI